MFNSHRRASLLGLACMAVCSAAFIGCSDSSNGGGGGGGGINPDPTTGRLTVTVEWPAGAARFIPSNTASIRLAVSGNTTGLATPTAQILPRGVTSATFAGLTPGTYTLVASAYATTDGTGTVLALGADTNVVITAGNTTTVNISMVSQAVSVTVALNPSTTDDVPAHTVTATLTAWTQAGGNGSMIPVDPTKVSWHVDRPQVATIQTVGNPVTVTPVSEGAGGRDTTTRIEGRYLELPVDLIGVAFLAVNSYTGTGVLNVNVSR